MHGGTVSVASPGEGAGSTFTVEIPVAVIHTHTESPDRVHPKSAGQRIAFEANAQLMGKRILVVDDEEDTRELLTFVLEQCGAQVRALDTATKALILIDEFRPHALVSDIGMPGMDGYEFIRELRERERALGLPRLPAAALTAYARVQDRMKVLSSGFQMHVPKPVEPAELVTVVASLVG